MKFFKSCIHLYCFKAFKEGTIMNEDKSGTRPSLKQSTFFQKMSESIANDIKKLENQQPPLSSQDATIEMWQTILGMFLLDKNGNNICDCMNEVTKALKQFTQAIEKYKQVEKMSDS